MSNSNKPQSASYIRDISIIQGLANDPEIRESDRELIKRVLSNSSHNGKGVMDLVRAAERGDALDKAEVILSQKSISLADMNKLRDLIQVVESEDLIIRELGPDKVKRFFSVLESRFGGKPYILPLSLEDAELGGYLAFELAKNDPEYQDGCVIDGIKGQPTKLAGNLLLSHLHRKPDFLNTLYDNKEISSQDLADFVDTMRLKTGPNSFYNLSLHFLLFNIERVKKIKKLRKKHFANSAMAYIKKLDAKFFQAINSRVRKT